MSEKKLKIIAVVLMVAAFICLAIGTAFAVDFMAEHPEEFACDLKRPVVAVNRPLVYPVVEPPLIDVVSVISSDIVYSAPLTSERSITISPDDSVSLPAGVSAFDASGFVGSFTGSSIYFLGLAEATYSFTYEAFDFDESPISLSLYQLTHLPYELVEIYSPTSLSFTSSNFYVDITFPAPEELSDSVILFFRSDSSYLARGEGEIMALFNDFSVGAQFTDSIVDILLSGLTSTGEAMGEAFSVLAESIFINADGTGLSTFGILVVVFAAVSLGLSLTRFVLNFCSSWGKRNR